MRPKASKAPKEKYENPPSKDHANWLLCSMGDISRLEYCLENFRQEKDNLDPFDRQKACSSTLLWSGEAGNNVPIELFNNSKIGFTLDPEKINVPYAEFLAWQTGSVLPQKEQTKKELGIDSKYDNKKGWSRNSRFTDSPIFATNHAKWEHEPESDDRQKSGHYRDEGSAFIFAKNVWRKYFKRDRSSLNEAMVIQKKGSPNPINGIFIDVTNGDIGSEEKAKLVQILQARQHLNLYVYDRRQTEHVVRVVNNLDATNLLQSNQDLNQVKVATLRPFRGFQLQLENDSSVQSPVKTMADEAREFIEGQGVLGGLDQLDLAAKKEILAYVWGGNQNDSIPIICEYDGRKNGFVAQVDYQPQLQRAQIFNDIVRDQLINSIAAQDSFFAEQYNKKHRELELDKFFSSDEEYQTAKQTMLALVGTGIGVLQEMKICGFEDVSHEPKIGKFENKGRVIYSVESTNYVFHFNASEEQLLKKFADSGFGKLETSEGSCSISVPENERLEFVVRYHEEKANLASKKAEGGGMREVTNVEVNPFEVFRKSSEDALASLRALLTKEDYEAVRKSMSDSRNEEIKAIIEKGYEEKRVECFSEIHKVIDNRERAWQLLNERPLSDADLEILKQYPISFFSAARLLQLEYALESNRHLVRPTHILTKIPELVEGCKEYQDTDGSTILMTALAQGEADEAWGLIEILDVGSPEINIQDTGHYQNTALILVAAKGWIGENSSGIKMGCKYHQIGEELIKRVADPNIRNGRGNETDDLRYTALDLAVARRDVEMVKVILSSELLEKETAERSEKYLSKSRDECLEVLKRVLGDPKQDGLSSVALVPRAELFSDNNHEILELLQAKIRSFDDGVVLPAASETLLISPQHEDVASGPTAAVTNGAGLTIIDHNIFPQPNAAAEFKKLSEAEQRKISESTRITVTEEEIEHAKKFIALVAITGGETGKRFVDSGSEDISQKDIYLQQGILPHDWNDSLKEADELQQKIEAVAAKITPENIRAFYRRLVEKRPKAFLQPDDRIVRCRENAERKIDLNINLTEYVGYSEIEFGAMLQVFGATQFINKGNRENRGEIGREGTYEKFGYISAIAGMRLETDDPSMERLHVIRGEREKARQEYDKSRVSGEKGDFARMKGVNGDFVDGHELIWGQFYGQNSQQQPGSPAAATGDFNDEVAERRLCISYKKFLAESIASAKQDEKKAHIRITGCGDGAWVGSDQNERQKYRPKVESAIGRAVRRAFDELAAEQKLQISAIEFCQHGANGNYLRAFTGGAQVEVIEGVKIIGSKAKFSDELKASEKRSDGKDTALCVNFAWDGGSYVGNEYWLGEGYFGASGDPAAACCSSIAFSMNPEINPQFLDKLFVVSQNGVVKEVVGDNPEQSAYLVDAKAVTASSAVDVEAKWDQFVKIIRDQDGSAAIAVVLQREFEELTDEDLKKILFTQQDHSKRTLLHLACLNNTSPEFVKVLLEKAKSVMTQTELEKMLHLQDLIGNTALHSALSDPYTDVIEEVLKYDLSNEIKNDYRNTPLHIAATSDLNATLNLVARCGEDINTLNKDGETPLFMAIRRRQNMENVKAILSSEKINLGIECGTTRSKMFTAKSKAEGGGVAGQYLDVILDVIEEKELKMSALVPEVHNSMTAAVVPETIPSSSGVVQTVSQPAGVSQAIPSLSQVGSGSTAVPKPSLVPGLLPLDLSETGSSPRDPSEFEEDIATTAPSGTAPVNPIAVHPQSDSSISPPPSATVPPVDDTLILDLSDSSAGGSAEEVLQPTAVTQTPLVQPPLSQTGSSSRDSSVSEEDGATTAPLDTASVNLADNAPVGSSLRESSLSLDSEQFLPLPATVVSPREHDNKIEVDTLHKVSERLECSVWKDDDRGNNYKTVNSTYGKEKPRARELADDVMKCILIKVLAEKGLTFDQLKAIVIFAKFQGGVNNKMNLAKEGYVRSDDIAQDRDEFVGLGSAGLFFKERDKDIADAANLIKDIQPNVIKAVSASFQQECKKLGILSGRGESQEGLRLTFLPSEVLKGLEKKFDSEGKLLKGSDAEATKFLSELSSHDLRSNGR